MYRKDCPNTIQSMFNSIAKRYDLTNSILSLSLHKRWNRALTRYLQEHSSPEVLLDLCSGTGDIAFEYLRRISFPCHAYLVDFSCDMLNQAKQKAKNSNIEKKHQLTFIEADVQNLPMTDQLFDGATMAYGIRNVKDPAQCFSEVFRVLKPGAIFGILELTRPHSRLLRGAHQLYLKTYVPLAGKLLTDNQQAYEYLNQSIQSFISTENLQKLLEKSGFVHTKSQPLSGGIASLVIGVRP